MECQDATSQALTNAKACNVKQVNMQQTLEPQYKVRDKVLESTKDINIQNVSAKIKPVWIGLFTILSANYYPNNYSLDLSIDPGMSFVLNAFHVSKVKPYINNNATIFTQLQLGKQAPSSQDSYKIEKVIEYQKAPRTGIPPYKVQWLRYSFVDD